jgi:hypothetical protein
MVTPHFNPRGKQILRRLPIWLMDNKRVSQHTTHLRHHALAPETRVSLNLDSLALH